MVFVCIFRGGGCFFLSDKKMENVVELLLLVVVYACGIWL